MAKRPLLTVACCLVLVGVGVWPIGCGLDWTYDPTPPGGGGEGGRHTGHPSAGPGGLVLPTTDDASATGTGTGDAPTTGAGASGAGGGGAAAASSSGASPLTCDEQALGCNGCADCSVGRGCAGSYEACQNNDACFYLQDCLYGCAETDAVCIDDCYYAYGAGEGLYTIAIQCIVCDDCSASCAQYQAEWGC